MGDDITIGVTEIVNNIEVTAQPNDQIVDISVIDNADDVTLNITPTVIEINVNKGSSYAKWGNISGTLSDQTDLQNALNLKANLVGGKVPASELPSYVDDVVEVANYAALPTTGETGKIYITLDNNKIYRWSGSVYIEIAANNAVWGTITGTLSNQTDLVNALNGKFNNPTGDTTQYIAGDGSLITFPIAGQSGTLVRQVRNITGATLTKGTIVYINGANGNKPTIAKAIATGDSTSAQTFGMLQADISNNANGYVVCVGDIIGLDTSAITEGTQLYLSSTTAGAYTTTKQVAPSHLVYIGVVTRSHPTLGQIEVKIQNGYELDEIHDVLITSKANNHFLVYESASSLWKNKSLGTVLGGTSSQFVKGDGSLDSNSYYLSSNPSGYITSSGSISGNAGSVNTVFNTTNADFYLTFADSNNGTPSAEFLYTIGSVKVNPNSGALTASSFIKSGGTSSQYLKADGSVSTLTNPITGTGTTNYLPKFTGSTALGNSLIYDNGTNILIGATTAPSVGIAKLALYGGSGGGIQMISAANNGGSALSPINGGGTLFYNYTGALGSESYSEVMRITSTGNVGIGTTTDAGYKLDVNGSARFSSAVVGTSNVNSNNTKIQISSTAASNKLGFSGGANNISEENLYVWNFTTAASTSIFFQSNGTITATAFVPLSDINLKNLVDYNYNVKLIKPITYIWKNNQDKRKKIGYSAQQVQEVLPEVVNTDEKGMLSVDYNQIFVAKIDTLENIIEELKVEIEILKKK